MLLTKYLNMILEIAEEMHIKISSEAYTNIIMRTPDSTLVTLVLRGFEHELTQKYIRWHVEDMLLNGWED